MNLECEHCDDCSELSLNLKYFFLAILRLALEFALKHHVFGLSLDAHNMSLNFKLMAFGIELVELYVMEWHLNVLVMHDYTWN